ncbi:MAG: M48 family metallopeptidase, partial [Wenzhouxiangellaceae bacterium]
VAAFVLAVIAIVVAMNLVVLLAFGATGLEGSGLPSASEADMFLPAIAITTVITVLIIVIASAWRTAQLRGGGARVASELGGVPVDGSTTDPLRRRLLNVVEEMAIASGVPVPRVFVLEQESGINAFAAGWSTTDAAVAVTRGALETLSREELQGVIAHEFSHVFNGDMRLNIRLMGVLFGILVIAVVGRRMLSSMRFSVGSSRNRKGGGIILVALGIMVIGYIGLFFGRWIQAAVSRQREYLADASAVQFTRSPDGIAGALKKIGALSSGSVLETNTDEVGHMLFASGLVRRMFATHPPLTERIREIDPSFQPREFASLARQMAEQSQSRAAEREQAQAAERQTHREHALPGILTGGAGGGLAEAIGAPGMDQMLLVAALLESVPVPLSRAAHSDEWAPELLLYLLLGRDSDLRERQLLMIAQARGSDSETKVRDLIGIEPELDVELRLPLLELAFPAMRRRPEREWLELMHLIDKLIEADGRVEVFEYVLARLLSHEIGQALNPPRRVPGGKRSVHDLAAPITDLLRVVAHHGQPDDPDAARAALAAAMRRVELGEPGAPPEGAHWQNRLDEALRALRDLSLNGREALLEALLECVRHDQKIRTREYELMRLVAGLLDVPLPPIAAHPES